jgi:hypothetical protein
MMEWLRTRNNLFEEDTLKESLMAVVESIRSKYDAQKMDEMTGYAVPFVFFKTANEILPS